MKLAQLFTLLVLVATSLASSAAWSDDPQSATCVLQNEYYAGNCVQNVPDVGSDAPDPRAACAEVVDYLNDQFSAGENYCDNTTIRGGWTLISASNGN